MFIPGTIPRKASTTLLTGRAVSSLALTVETAPVRFTFFVYRSPQPQLRRGRCLTHHDVYRGATANGYLLGLKSDVFEL